MERARWLKRMSIFMHDCINQFSQKQFESVFVSLLGHSFGGFPMPSEIDI